MWELKTVPEASIRVPAGRKHGLPSTDGIASRCHTTGKCPLIVGDFGVIGLFGFLLSDSLLLLSLPAAHGAARRADSRPDCRSLSCVSADRTANGANRRATGCTTGRTALGRRRCRLLHRLIRIEPRLLFGPFVATELILLLLLFRLSFAGIHEDLDACKRLLGHEQQSHQDEQQSSTMHKASSRLADERSLFRWFR